MPSSRAVHARTTAAVLSLITLAAPQTLADVEPRWPLPAFTEGLVKRSLLIALDRVATARCRAVFEDFTGGDGRTLATKLEQLGESPGQHLRGLRFVSGISHPRCKDPNVLLVTRVGASSVYVCPQQFTAFAEKQPVKAAGLVVHEQLHALGLGENPPSSEEISRQVWTRCGR